MICRYETNLSQLKGKLKYFDESRSPSCDVVCVSYLRRFRNFSGKCIWLVSTPEEACLRAPTSVAVAVANDVAAFSCCCCCRLWCCSCHVLLLLLTLIVQMLRLRCRCDAISIPVLLLAACVLLINRRLLWERVKPGFYTLFNVSCWKAKRFLVYLTLVIAAC